MLEKEAAVKICYIHQVTFHRVVGRNDHIAGDSLERIFDHFCSDPPYTARVRLTRYVVRHPLVQTPPITAK